MPYNTHSRDGVGKERERAPGLRQSWAVPLPSRREQTPSDHNKTLVLEFSTKQKGIRSRERALG